MTDETTNHIRDARALLAAAHTLLSSNLTGEHRCLPDMIEAILCKVSEELDQVSKECPAT